MRMSPYHLYILPFLFVLVAAATSSGPEVHARYTQAPIKKETKDTNSVQSTDTSGWKIYRSDKDGFQLKYPAGWTVSSSAGTPPEIIYFRAAYRGVMGRALSVTIQRNMNPRKLSIEEWFAEQMRMVDASKIKAKGCSIIARRPACFFESTDKSEKNRTKSIYTLLHETDVVSFEYDLSTEDDSNYAAIINSFEVVK